MLASSNRAAAFSLIELLLVLTVLGILVGLALPSSDPSVAEQLRAAARLVATDLAYGRSLAVNYNSTYRFTFDSKQNRYVLEHSGSNAALNVLPRSPFRSPNDPPTQHIVSLDELPVVGPPMKLVAVTVGNNAMAQATTLEFGPLGETTRAEPTTIWLAAGRGTGRRYLPITVHPVTGMAEVGSQRSQGPPGVTSGEGP
jgi:prepilin-type N-terminal cleavage/methylation domain-containing protein